MTFTALLVVLLWEYLKPLRASAPVTALFERYAEWLLQRVNAGMAKHGMLAWAAGVLLPALAAGGVGALLGEAWTPLEWALGVVVLYLCLGYRQYAMDANELALILGRGETQQARKALAKWYPGPVEAMPDEELARVAIEHSLRLALARLFGVLFWFSLLGVFGAVLYRLSMLCRQRWHGEPAFAEFPEQAAQLLEWLPARVMAASFAIVGNFEDALYCWRTQAGSWTDRNMGVVLAAGAGALGVRLGGPLTLHGGELLRAEVGMGVSAAGDFLEGAVNLIWRAVALWLAVLGLLWLGGL